MPMSGGYITKGLLTMILIIEKIEINEWINHEWINNSEIHKRKEIRGIC